MHIFGDDVEIIKDNYSSGLDITCLYEIFIKISLNINTDVSYNFVFFMSFYLP